MIRLALRLNAVARLRESASARSPSLVAAAHAASLGGADGLRLQLGEPEGLIRDAQLLFEDSPLPLTVEVSPAPGEVARAAALAPEAVGLYAAGPSGVRQPLALPEAGAETRRAVGELRAAKVPAILWLRPQETALLDAGEMGVEAVELDASRFTRARTEEERVQAFLELGRSARSARELGLRVRLSGGIDARSARRLATIPEVEEVVVGRSVIARALFTGLEAAVRELRRVFAQARGVE